MKKILVMTDSLALPRAKPEICKYEEIWPVLLRRNDFYVHQISIGGATIDELFRQVEYHFMSKPDIVIIQSGIVDSAPRALTKFENLIFNKYKLTRMILKKFLVPHLNFLRNKRKITYTDLDKFEKYVLKFKKAFSATDFYWIAIIPPNIEYEMKVPGISKNVSDFNMILEKHLGKNLIKVVDVSKGVMSDNIHLNAEGHENIFDSIIKKMDLDSIMKYKHNFA